VTTYLAESDAGNHRWVRIEVARSQVVSAFLDEIEGREFGCRMDECRGITLGERDALGARAIVMRGAELAETSVGAAPNDGVVLEGELRLEGENQAAGLACTDQGVSIVSAQGSAVTFCPHDGAGFEVGDDGNRTYRFTSLNGGTLLVGVDQASRVQRVEYIDDGVERCTAAQCAGVGVSAPGAAGERTFTFLGTSLSDAEGMRSATLNGTLKVPAL
jgi:hypothetical protein